MDNANTLVVMRHAEALLKISGQRDFDRPLAPKGIEDARAMGRWLHNAVPHLGAVMSSPALRARMTTAAVTGAWAIEPSITFPPALYLAELPVLLELAQRAEAVTTLWIGHNPGLEAFLAHLLPADESVENLDLQLSTGAIAVIELDSRETRMARGSGRLRLKMAPERLL